MSKDAVSDDKSPAGSTEERPLWQPLGESAFAFLWIGMLISTTGSWMHETASGWLMATMTDNPAVIVLVQAANTLPIFLFGLLAGALADRLDKRRFLIRTNLILAGIVGVFALLVASDLVTPTLLVLFTFLIGMGAAFSAPAWQAMLPDVVTPPNLKNALALNSLGINLSRAIGPAAAGFLIAGAGMAMPFALNAASYLAVVMVLVIKHPVLPATSSYGKEPLWSAIGTGLRHTRNNLAMRDTLVRAIAFFLPASALWALLPVVAKSLPNGSATTLGLMTGAIGAGAVAGAVILPGIRSKWGTNRVAERSAYGLGAALVLMSLSHAIAPMMLACAVAGFAWIGSLTSFHVSAQTALPRWVRARGLSVFLTVFFGAMTVGSILWGQVAQTWSLEVSLWMAAVVLPLGALLTRGFELGSAATLNLSPSMHWPAAPIDDDVLSGQSESTVTITIAYVVNPDQQEGFLQAMNVLRAARLRTGAYRWGIQQQSDDARQWQEWFTVPSWEEHLRQHERFTESDRISQEAVHAFHEGDGKPVVTHWLGRS